MSLETKIKKIVKYQDIAKLIKLLKESGFITIAPVVSEKTIIYDEIESIKELPIGWADEQEKGTYSLKKTEQKTLFSYAVGAHSWKKYLHPPIETIFKAVKKGNSFEIQEKETNNTKYAFIGVRGCELEAIKIQDKIFMEGEFVNQTYKATRENIFIISVNCGSPAKTCFCTSMNTGPKVKSGFDLNLTEVFDHEEHYFIIESGSAQGELFLAKLQTENITEKALEQEKEIISESINKIQRNVDTNGLKEKLANSYDSKHWEDISKICMSCTNCTMVCPTCFCTSVEDITDLTGTTAERVKKWDSCFTMDFSYIHGNVVRQTTASRYRQWLTHKFSSWVDQFDTFGCVGCGRCITWCPVGIDITEELKKVII